jgi:hypothetical protein
MKKIAVCLFALFWLTQSPAQEETVGDASEVEEMRRYTVEVIVFRNVEDFGLGTEQFYPDPLPAEPADGATDDDPDHVDEVEVVPTARRMDLLTFAVNAHVLHFELLQEDEYTMTGIFDRFELLDAYEPILHTGWTQPTLPPELAEPVGVRVIAPLAEGLDGEFTLYMSRYLHLVADIRLAAAAPASEVPDAEAPVPTFGDPVAPLVDPLLAPEQPVYYRIQEDRIVRNGDIRYFDHPKFGIVAKITRVEPENEAPGEDVDLLASPRQ